MLKVERRRVGVINQVRSYAEGFHQVKPKRGYVKQINQLAFHVEAKEKKDTMAAPSRAALLICNTVCCDVNSDHHRLLQIHTLAAMGITSALQGTGMPALSRASTGAQVQILISVLASGTCVPS